MGETFRGTLDGAGLRIAIVVAKFNEEITSRMAERARTTLAEHGVAETDIDVAHVPGSFEVPFAARRLAASGGYQAVICIGAVIKRDTSHDKYISTEVARGIAEAARDTGVPVVFGVITPDTHAQAVERAETKDKGREAALTALEMANLARQLPGR